MSITGCYEFRFVLDLHRAVLFAEYGYLRLPDGTEIGLEFSESSPYARDHSMLMKFRSAAAPIAEAPTEAHHGRTPVDVRETGAGPQDPTRLLPGEPVSEVEVARERRRSALQAVKDALTELEIASVRFDQAARAARLSGCE